MLGLMPGEHDPLYEAILRQRSPVPRGFGGGLLSGGAAGGGILGGITEKLMSPTAQLGAMILANSGGRGAGIGQAVAGFGQQRQAAEQQKLQQELMRAQIERLRQPEMPKMPEQPADIREYEYAKSQGFKGSYLDFQTELRKAGASSVSVNTGSELPKPPPGFYRPSPSAPGLTAEPGGPAALEIEEAERKRRERAAAASAQAGNVLETVNSALQKIGPSTVGIGGAILQRLPGTSAVDLSGELETIKANLGFDRIQQMREQSPTGGALGSVAVQELNALQSTVASLDQKQSPEQLRRSLSKIRDHYSRWERIVQASQSGSTNAAPGSRGFIDRMVPQAGPANDPLGILK